MTSVRVVKGHATENDFIIIDDQAGEFALSPALVRALCDRHAGIGADGILRLVRCENDPDGAAMAAEARYFMDYRNADGTVAEMCGNGVRLFLRYLQSVGLAGSQAAVATRGGVRRVWAESDLITVEMGRAEVLAAQPTVRTQGSPVARTGVAVIVPNPHVVLAVASTDELAALDLTVSPIVERPLPDGQNVEFVVTLGPRHLALRVHERGVGETRSCGTGICAAVVASSQGESERDGSSWQVDVPGGTCFVRRDLGGELLLTGPAELVGEVELDAAWLATIDAPAVPAALSALSRF